MTNTEQTSPEVGGRTKTTLERRWVVRMVIISVVLWAFGAWGFYDATVVYPKRGRLFAEKMQLEYLRVAQRSGRIFDAAIADPRGELEQLRGKELLQISEFDRAKREWLDALAVPGLGMLNPEHTQFDPTTELERLEAYFSKNSPPAGLSAYDILMQWVICGVCWAIGAYMLVLFIVVKSKSFTWAPESRTLTLPGGATVAPADLDPEEPADLSKWHKFIIFLRPRQGHERLSGDIKLDLFRYHPLETWVVELVKAANPGFEFPDEHKRREEAERAALAEAESRGDGGDEAGDPN